MSARRPAEIAMPSSDVRSRERRPGGAPGLLGVFKCERYEIEELLHQRARGLHVALRDASGDLAAKLGCAPERAPAAVAETGDADHDFPVGLGNRQRGGGRGERVERRVTESLFLDPALIA